jgi:hypothetical protein
VPTILKDEFDITAVQRMGLPSTWKRYVLNCRPVYGVYAEEYINDRDISFAGKYRRTTVYSGQALLASRLRLTLSAGVTKPSWLDLTTDLFYLISCDVLQCMEYHWTTKVKQETIFPSSEC